MEENLTQEQSLIKRIVICGPESTGKSTMTENLSVHFNTNYVDEFAREFLQKKWDIYNEVCTKEDLIKIAKGQIELENTKIKSANKLIFCDTNISTTLAWSKTHFDGYFDPWILSQSKLLKYDYYLLLNTDVAWIKDDLRDSPNDREKMFLAHKFELDILNVNYDIIEGSNFDKRLKQAVDYIKKSINLELNWGA
jgi:NadR type nicotinamide-nucleotide adenylyltransferase